MPEQKTPATTSNGRISAQVSMALTISHKEGNTDPVTRAELTEGINEVTKQLHVGATSGVARFAGGRVMWSLRGDLED